MNHRMIQVLACVGLVSLLVTSMGAVKALVFDVSRITTQVSATFQGPYEEIASLSSANGNPAVGARNYTTLAALADTAMAIWEVPQGVNAVTLRFRIGAEDDTGTVRALTFRTRANPGDYADDGSLAYQWVVVGGAMTAVLGGVYCDTGTATAYALAGGTANTVQTDWIYEYELDLAGVAYVAFYRTDAESVVVDIDAAVY